MIATNVYRSDKIGLNGPRGPRSSRVPPVAAPSDPMGSEAELKAPAGNDLQPTGASEPMGLPRPAPAVRGRVQRARTRHGLAASAGLEKLRRVLHFAVTGHAQRNQVARPVRSPIRPWNDVMDR